MGDIAFFLLFLGSVIWSIIMIVQKKFDFAKSVILGLFTGGLIIIWGIGKASPETLPVWIQAGATLSLLIITAMSTYATMVTAQANRDLAEVTRQQLIMDQTERKSKIIKEIAQTVFQPIIGLIEQEKDAVESGYIIVSFLYSKKYHSPFIGADCDAPNLFLKKMVYHPDSILLKKMDEIKTLGNRYREHCTRMNALLERIYVKQQTQIKNFEDFCISLKGVNDQIIFPQDTENIFSLAFADTYRHEYNGYNFFDKYRLSLTSKIVDLGFQDDSIEYKKNQAEFLEIASDYEKMISELFCEWKVEYSLTGDEIYGTRLGFQV